MKILSIILISILVISYLILRYRTYILSKWGGLSALRIAVHCVLLLLIAVGVYYSFKIEEGSITQKFVLAISFGAFLFWITPFCFKFFKHTWGVAFFIIISVSSSLCALYLEINEIVKEYLIELSVGIVILLFFEFFLKERNRELKKRVLAEYNKLIASIERKDAIRKEEELLRIQKESEDDYKYAIRDYLGLPRPLAIMQDPDDADDKDGGVILS